MAENKIGTKKYQGTFAGGQGPIQGLQSDTTPDYSPIHGGEGKHVKQVSDGGMDSKPSGEDKQFDLHSTSYAGPENMQPTNKGVVNPDDISSDGSGMVKSR